MVYTAVNSTGRKKKEKKKKILKEDTKESEWWKKSCSRRQTLLPKSLLDERGCEGLSIRKGSRKLLDGRKIPDKQDIISNPLSLNEKNIYIYTVEHCDEATMDHPLQVLLHSSSADKTELESFVSFNGLTSSAQEQFTGKSPGLDGLTGLTGLERSLWPLISKHVLCFIYLCVYF